MQLPGKNTWYSFINWVKKSLPITQNPDAMKGNIEKKFCMTSPQKNMEIKLIHRKEIICIYHR